MSDTSKCKRGLGLAHHFFLGKKVVVHSYSTYRLQCDAIFNSSINYSGKSNIV